MTFGHRGTVLARRTPARLRQGSGTSETPRRLAFLASLSLLLGACGGDPASEASAASGSGGGSSSGGSGGDALEVCPVQHPATTGDDHAVVVCDEPHPAAPRVRLPAKHAAPGDAAAQIAYGWLSGPELRTIDGETFAVDPGDLETEHVRLAFTFYRLEIDASAALIAWKPAVVVDEGVLLAPLLGRAAEGLVSARVADMEFDLETTLPIRVRFDAVVADDQQVFSLPAGVRKELRGVIENLEDAVTADDGSCLPALASHGDADPFLGASTASLIGIAAPSMHTLNDNHFVVVYVLDEVSGGSVMGPAWFPTLEPLATGEEVVFGPYSGAPHGSPTSIPSIDLSLVDGGGAACN
jgi:hypothetical protein